MLGTTGVTPKPAEEAAEEEKAEETTAAETKAPETEAAETTAEEKDEETTAAAEEEEWVSSPVLSIEYTFVISASFLITTPADVFIAMRSLLILIM